MGAVGAGDAAVVVASDRGVLAGARLADPLAVLADVDLVGAVDGDVGVVVEAVNLDGSAVELLPAALHTLAVVDLLHKKNEERGSRGNENR